MDLEKHYLLLKQHLKNFCNVYTAKDYLVIRSPINSYRHLTLQTKDEYYLISGHQGDQLLLLKMTKLFHMEKALVRLEKPKKNTGLCESFYKMNRSFIENKYYPMIFALTLTKDSEAVSRMRHASLAKYKLLKLMKVPTELSLEISSYLIQFILMCMI